MNSPEGMPRSSRRTSSWFNAAALAVAITACAVLGVLITARKHVVFDRTATRQHALSPRTQQLIDRLDRDLTLIVAADMGSIDRASRQRTLDVLGQFESASSRLKVRLIDTTTSAGQAQYAQVLTDLAAGEKEIIEDTSKRILVASGKADSLAKSLDALQTSLLKIKDEHGSHGGEVRGNLSGQYLQTQAAVLRVASQDLRAAGRTAQSRLSTPDPLLPVPAIDKALAELKKPVTDASAAITSLADDFDSLSRDPRSNEYDKAAAGLALPDLRSARDAAGQISTELAAIEIPRVLRVSKALQLRSAALLIDEQAKPGAGVGVTAINVDSLLGLGGEGLDLRARTEDLVAGAVASMTSGIRPVVCVVHGAPTRLSAMNWPLFQSVSEQLALRGIDLMEWPCALDAEMPALATMDTTARPVVFVTLTAQGGSRESSQGIALGIAAYSKALNRIVADGRSVLLSVNLSQVPSTGSPDPLTECLSPLGLSVDSGRPLLQEGKVDTRRVAYPVQDIVDPHGSHPLSGAIRGLPLRMRWPLVVTSHSSVQSVRVEPVITVPADGTRWQESEWQEFYRAVSRRPEEDSLRVIDGPQADSPRDGTGSGSGWCLAAAIEVVKSEGKRQRLVIVGANGWFLDDLTAQRREVDGRIVPLFPGNLQLLESSVLWLAGQDDQVMRGATLASVPTIPALTAAQVSWLRWLLIVVMPALALACGLVYRLWRP